MAKPQKMNKPTAQSKDKEPALLGILIAVLIAFPIGYVTGSRSDDTTTETANSSTQEDHDHPEGTPVDHAHDDDETKEAEHDDTNHDESDDHTSSNMPHSHGMFDATNLEKRPEIKTLSVSEDEKSGWNLTFETENFTMTPENINTDHVDNEGHAHLYINDKKITRLYSNNYHIDDLDPGTHTIKVTLNTNKHDEYAVDGSVISLSMTIKSSDDQHSSHQ